MAMKTFTIQIDESLVPAGYEPKSFEMVRVDRCKPKVKYLAVGSQAGQTTGHRIVDGRKSDGPRLTFSKVLTEAQKILVNVARGYGSDASKAQQILRSEGVTW